MGRTDTLEEFITKARKAHGNKYNYDKVKYINNRTEVIITCPIHGDFPQTPGAHKRGQGCPYCAKEKRLEALRENAKIQTEAKEDFIRKAKSVHGDKYNYDNVEFVNTRTPVMVTCPKHGDFPVIPNNHTSRKCGCPECARERNREAQTDALEEFIAKAKAVHGDKYSYDKVMYVNSYTLVNITCPKHSDFQMLPYNHKAGHGCPKCNQSHLENETMMLLEKNSIIFETQKRFPWLKNKCEMPLDFYLPEYNIAIECQGIQHYLTEGNGYFTTESVKVTQKNDKLKYKLCQEHGIQIYYIKYDEDIEKKLSDILNNISKQKGSYLSS